MNEWMNEWMCIYIPHISHSVPRRFTILLEWDRTSACQLTSYYYHHYHYHYYYYNYYYYYYYCCCYCYHYFCYYFYLPMTQIFTLLTVHLVTLLTPDTTIYSSYCNLRYIQAFNVINKVHQQLRPHLHNSFYTNSFQLTSGSCSNKTVKAVCKNLVAEFAILKP